jgi:hypothetical protein
MKTFLLTIAFVALRGLDFAGAAETPSITINWPTPDVVMQPGTPVGIWGTESGTEESRVLVAVQNNRTGLWLTATGSFGDETWFNAPVVDANGTWRWIYTPMSTGSFTVLARLVGALTTNPASSSFTVGSQPDPNAPPSDPTQGFPLRIVNGTSGRWADTEIWVTIVGQQTKDNWSYLSPDGSVHHIDHTQADSPGHVTHDGVNYAPLSFQLPLTGMISMPPNLQGARVYISLGSPLCLSISPDDSGIALPDVNNPSDPNAGTYWDFYEYTFVNGEVAYGGNTSQVDQFGFPINVRVEQDWAGFDRSTAYLASRDSIRNHFLNGSDRDYGALVNEYHILSPRTSVAFRTSSTSELMQSYIDAVWQHYRSSEFKLMRLDQLFRGRVEDDGVLHFAFQGTEGYILQKPTADDVWQCDGALAAGGDVEKALGAEFCAAFNRGVADSTASWWDSSHFYRGSVKNEFAAYIHSTCSDARAYAFAYDDIDDQSTVIILPNTVPPSRVTLTIAW